MAFALVSLGAVEVSEFSPLQLLINTLNSRARQGEALALPDRVGSRPGKSALRSIQRSPAEQKDEKIYLSRIMARSGDKDSLPPLEK